MEPGLENPSKFCRPMVSEKNLPPQTGLGAQKRGSQARLQVRRSDEVATQWCRGTLREIP
jgi:hypothetical protein